MKKKILLSVLAVISIMAANKTFAQYYNHNRHDDHGFYNERMERFYDIRDIHHDQENIAYTLRRIEQKKAELRHDIACGRVRAYREDQIELQRLYRALADDRAALVRDTREVYGNRVAVRF